MALHLIKLAVGCDSVADLEEWIKLKLKERKKRGQKPERIHTTRMLPKRAEELTDGGSLFWVIKGQITSREKILDIRSVTGKDGIRRCQNKQNNKPKQNKPQPQTTKQNKHNLEDK